MKPSPKLDFSSPHMALASGPRPVENRNALKKATRLQKFMSGVLLSVALLGSLAPTAHALSQDMPPPQGTEQVITLDQASKPANDILNVTSDGKHDILFNRVPGQIDADHPDLDSISISEMSGRSWYDFSFNSKTERLSELDNEDLINHTGRLVNIARYQFEQGASQENPNNNLIEICKFVRPAMQEFNNRALSETISGTEQTFEVCSSKEMITTTHITNVKSVGINMGQAVLGAVAKTVLVVGSMGVGLVGLAGAHGLIERRKEKQLAAQVAENTPTDPSSDPPSPTMKI